MAQTSPRYYVVQELLPWNPGEILDTYYLGYNDRWVRLVQVARPFATKAEAETARAKQQRLLGRLIRVVKR